MSLSAIAGALLVAALQNETPLVSDPAWKQWLEEVKPLMLRAERDAARKLPASARETFREQFWAARDQDPATTFNETRSAFNHRVESADRRYRQSDGGPWNDCGRAFVLFGPPDVRNEVRIMAQAWRPIAWPPTATSRTRSPRRGPTATIRCCRRRPRAISSGSRRRAKPSRAHRSGG